MSFEETRVNYLSNSSLTCSMTGHTTLHQLPEPLRLWPITAGNGWGQGRATHKCDMPTNKRGWVVLFNGKKAFICIFTKAIRHQSYFVTCKSFLSALLKHPYSKKTNVLSRLIQVPSLMHVILCCFLPLTT